MKYEVWPMRALLIWVPVCLLLGLLPPVASLVLAASAYEVPWHIHIVNSLMPLVVGFIVWRRHDLHVGIRDSIDRSIAGGAWLVIDVPYMSQAEIDAIEHGLVQAQLQCSRELEAPRSLRALERKFVIVKAEVTRHMGGKKEHVGGLTYFAGPMLLAYTTDLKLLQDRARHEGCHAVLNSLGYADWTGEMHHQQFPELFS